IQAGYYGRPLDPTRPSDPKDQEGFAYPLYIVFYLAPSVGLPFAIVKEAFLWLLLILTAASAVIWIRLLLWPPTRIEQFAVVILTLGSLPVMQGLKLQQITLLVVALLAFAALSFAADRQWLAGVLLAIASIKPQLVVFPLLWLAIWTLADLRRRYRWAASFAIVMAVQVAAAEYYLPHWIPRFWRAVLNYREYTGATSMLEVMVGAMPGRVIEILLFVLLMRVCWKSRSEATSSAAFATTTSTVLALTLLLIPGDSVYNQVLLMPAVLLLVRDWPTIWAQSWSVRLLFALTALLIAWPWMSSVVLVASSFIMPPAKVQEAWALPFWTVIPTPLGVAALMLARIERRIFAASPMPAPS
ncbi:MAG TPA: glycosyltransferase family 87 protein, partial [Terriglobales bacterium]|nr:glycosyltransferase family 87 protein [Terriglobales bacterium]